MTRDEWDDRIAAEAVYWTTARRVGIARYDREEHATLEAARAHAIAKFGADGRTMIYAVDKDGHDAWRENV